MQTKQIVVYDFNELSDTAKGKVRLWVDTFEFVAETVLDDFKTIVEILGFSDVTPRYSGFWSQGDGASFTGRYSYAKGAAKKIREYAPQDAELHRIADGLQALQRVNFYRLRATLSLGSKSNYYSHENTISFNVYDSENEYRTVDEETFKELTRELMQWLYKTLEREYDYCNTDEYIAEHCEANGYQFDEYGTIA